VTDADDAGPDREPSDSRQRADRLGELLPEGTRDESVTGWGEREDAGDPDERLRREVPPHHG
jgi:hypothetical protein